MSGHTGAVSSKRDVERAENNVVQHEKGSISGWRIKDG